MSSLVLMEDVLLLLINVDQFTNVININSDVEMDLVDQLKACAQELIILVQLIDNLDVKSELVPLMSIVVRPLMDVTTNIHKDVQRPDNVLRLKLNVKIIMLILLYQMDV